jgi:hypothetical protein
MTLSDELVALSETRPRSTAPQASTNAVSAGPDRDAKGDHDRANLSQAPTQVNKPKHPPSRCAGSFEVGRAGIEHPC